MSKADRNKKVRAERQAEAAAVTAPAHLKGRSWAEFVERLNALAVAYSFATRGLRPIADEYVQSMQALKVDVDTRLKVTPPPPWKDGRVPGYGEILVGDGESFLGVRGTVEAQIGHSWAVTVYSEWEDHYRERIAGELDLPEKDSLKVSAFGDLGLFRNDIVHHRAIAKKKDSGRAKLFRHWIELDKPIFIGEEQIVEFMDQLGLVKWEGQETANEFLAAMSMADAERKRLGVNKLAMRLDKPPLVKCRRCKLPRETDGPDCTKCGLEQAFSSA
jgi:hypothetical protein